MNENKSARDLLLAPFQQRLPFLPLLLAAVAGILLGDFIPFSEPIWLSLAGSSLAAWLLTRRGTWFWIFLITAFGLSQVWQSRDSTAARFAATFQGPELVSVTGTVASEPRIFAGDRCSFELRLSRLDRPGLTQEVHFKILADWKGAPPVYGDTVILSGVLESLEPPRNPGQFDFASWSRQRGIYLRLKADGAEASSLTHTGRENPLIALAIRCQDWMRHTLTAGVNDPTVSDLLVAMTLGETSALPQQIQEQFRGTGTYHLFSVSGLHVGLLALILWYTLKTLGFSRRYAAAVIIPALFFYALMTGWKPASVRSAIMSAIVLMGYFANRPPILFNNFCAAAFLLLLIESNLIFNAGFQLSFAVVASILFLAEPLATLIARPFRTDPFFPEKLLSPLEKFGTHWGQKFASACAVSLAAWLGSLPLTIGYFHLISFTALPANLAAILISFGIMAVAILSLGAGAFSLSLAIIFNQTNWLLAKVLLSVVGFFASLPGSFCYVKIPEYPRPVVTLVVFDFGLGGACYLSASGENWLIDTGPARMHDAVLLPFLRSQGVQRLDGLILTHGDAMHIGAATKLLQTCQPKLVVESALTDRSSVRKQFHHELQARGLAKSLYRANDTLSIAPGVLLRILYPPGGLTRSVADDKAMVLQLEAAGTRILLLSDAGFFTEDWLLQNAPGSLPSDMVIRGAAGDSLSGDPSFLRAIDPSVLVTTHDPRGELPAPWAALASQDVRLFRQAETGAVIIKIFSDRYEVSGFANKQYFSRHQ